MWKHYQIQDTLTECLQDRGENVLGNYKEADFVGWRQNGWASLHTDRWHLQFDKRFGEKKAHEFKSEGLFCGLFVWLKSETRN